jgi:regulatory protein YycI of two-component signal transduction system YycFG
MYYTYNRSKTEDLHCLQDAVAVCSFRSLAHSMAHKSGHEVHKNNPYLRWSRYSNRAMFQWTKYPLLTIQYRIQQRRQRHQDHGTSISTLPSVPFSVLPRENPTSTSYAQKQRKTQEPLRRKESWMKGVDAIEAIYYE